MRRGRSAPGLHPERGAVAFDLGNGSSERQKSQLTSSPDATVGDSLASLIGSELVLGDGHDHVAASVAPLRNVGLVAAAPLSIALRPTPAPSSDEHRAHNTDLAEVTEAFANDSPGGGTA